MQDKVVGNIFRSREQLKPNLVWEIISKIIQSNARFGLTDRLEVHLDHVRIPSSNGQEKTKGRSLDTFSAIKKVLLL